MVGGYQRARTGPAPAPADLIVPTDLHVERQARALGLLTRQLVDWRAAEELTANLRLLDADDPVKYDFALFGEEIDGGKR